MSSDATTSTLGEVLMRPEGLLWSDDLYLPGDGEWTLVSPAMVLPDDGEDVAPPRAREAGLDYVLDITTVQSIVANARDQRPGATPADLLEAFCHYVDNDAFVVWGS